MSVSICCTFCSSVVLSLFIYLSTCPFFSFSVYLSVWMLSVDRILVLLLFDAHKASVYLSFCLSFLYICLLSILSAVLYSVHLSLICNSLPLIHRYGFVCLSVPFLCYVPTYVIKKAYCTAPVYSKSELCCLYNVKINLRILWTLNRLSGGILVDPVCRLSQP